MDRLAHRAALAAACALLGLTALLPTTASALTTNNYCGVLISAGSWCGDGSNHFYNYNNASYTGGGSVWVCERLMIADSTTQREAPICSYNLAYSPYGSYVFATEAEVSHWTGANHTIYGLGQY
jgi:hypothetical protein